MAELRQTRVVTHSTDPKQPLDAFQRVAACVLSTLLGVLITIPLSQQGAMYMPIVGAAIGLLVGLRRRGSRAFFFFVLIGCGIMTSLLLGQFSLEP